MIDWQWIPGVVIGAGAAGHSLWLRARFRAEVQGQAAELRQRAENQRAHAMMLWPRPWLGDRPLTQVEQIIEAGKGWLGNPLDPEQQFAKMMRDSQALLDSYQPPGGDDDGDSPAT